MVKSDEISQVLYTSDEPLKIVVIEDAMTVRKRDDPIILSGKKAKYILGEVLGSGSYAQVMDAVEMVTLERKAIKVFNNPKKRRLTDPLNDKVADVLEEVKIIRSLNHRNVLKLQEVFQNDSQDNTVIYVVMEYCSATVEEMRKMAVDMRIPLPSSHAIFKQLIQGLEYIHSKGIIHLDIKPDNLLVTNCRIVKIADFGSAARIGPFKKNDMLSEAQGSYWFQPPEVLPVDFSSSADTTYHGFLVDTWAAGITLYNISTGHYPFVPEDAFLSDLYKRIMEGHVNKHEVLERNPFLLDLISKILVVDPKKRLGIEGIKHHLWFMNEENQIPYDLIPPRFRYSIKSDKYRSMTMTPTLHQLHYPDYEVVEVPDTEYDSFEAKKKTPILRPNRSPSRKKKNVIGRIRKSVNRVRGFF